jgi:hypothetical protein
LLISKKLVDGTALKRLISQIAAWRSGPSIWNALNAQTI